MKKLLTYGAIAFAAFAVWQWWLSRRTSPELHSHLKEQEDKQRMGKGAANAQIAATYPLAEFVPAPLADFVAAVTNPFLDAAGRVTQSKSSTPYHPFVFGYGKN